MYQNWFADHFPVNLKFFLTKYYLNKHLQISKTLPLLAVRRAITPTLNSNHSRKILPKKANIKTV